MRGSGVSARQSEVVVLTARMETYGQGGLGLLEVIAVLSLFSLTALALLHAQARVTSILSASRRSKSELNSLLEWQPDDLSSANCRQRRYAGFKTALECRKDSAGKDFPSELLLFID